MMAFRNLIAGFLALITLITIAAGRLPPQTAGKAWLLGCPVDEATAVRFFYNPELADYFHSPLVFRVVRVADPRLNTGPITREGRTTYITPEEMKAMLRALGQSAASWGVSSKVEPLGDSHGLIGFKTLHILVVCSKGTAQATVEPAKVCSTLAPLDSALSTARALWEFQLLRIGYGCKVPGFNMDAYPERR